MVAHPCNPNNGKTEAGRSQVTGIFGYEAKFNQDQPNICKALPQGRKKKPLGLKKTALKHTHTNIVFYFGFVFGSRDFLHSPGYPETHYIDHTGLKHGDLPTAAS